VGKEKCVSVAIKNDLGMCLRKLALCLYGDCVNIIAVKQPLLHCGSCILWDPHYFNSWNCNSPLW